MTLLLLLTELIGLYFLSRWLTKKLYLLFLLLFKARPVAISAVTLLLFPGTVVHELSHLFTAEILGVRTGKLTLVPEGVRPSSFSRPDPVELRIGSVAIAATGPLRRAAIGLSPIFAGILTLAAISYFLRRPPAVLQGDALQNALVYGVGFYLLFSISNSMFSSKEALKGFWPLAIILGLFIGAAYFMGIRIGLEGKTLEVVTTILSSLIQSLGLVLAINTLLLLLTSILIAATRNITA